MPTEKPKTSRKTLARSEAADRKHRTWSTPRSLSFGAGLESIVKSSAKLAARVQDLADEVPFTVATKTVSGNPIQDQIGRLGPENLDQFRPREDAQQLAIEKLISEGCRLIRKGRFSVTMAGPAALVEQLIGGKLVVQARARRSQLPATQMFASDFERPFARDVFLAPPTSLSMAFTGSEDIDHLVFVPPPLFFAPPAADPPKVTFNHVDEERIRRLLKVPAGLDGTGVTVGLVDTGFYPHPYYQKRGYSLTPVPTTSGPKPQIDDYGHGTAIAFNIFAVAPKAEVLGFLQTEQPQDALEDAADRGVDILSCSWGWDREQLFPVVQATILDIVRNGTIVLFAAGNGHYAWPGSQPEVVSVGGVYCDEKDAAEASNYASGYMSGMFANRRVPDVSGLCGQAPKAIYIMMPTQPGNTMDRENGGSPFPTGDGSGERDGWVGASGTSSATPQIAGVVALMVQAARLANETLTPALAKRCLEESCTAVEAGRNAMGFPAVGQPNNAVGYGLVDAGAAIAGAQKQLAGEAGV